MRESLKIINIALNEVVDGPFKSTSLKVTPPDRDDLRNSMELTVDYFKFYCDGIKLHEDSFYISTETPKGELGVYLLTTNKNRPYRVKIRSPGYHHLQGLGSIVRKTLVSDLVTIIGSLDIVFGEIDR